MKSTFLDSATTNIPLQKNDFALRMICYNLSKEKVAYKILNVLICCIVFTWCVFSSESHNENRHSATTASMSATIANIYNGFKRNDWHTARNSIVIPDDEVIVSSEPQKIITSSTFAGIAFFSEWKFSKSKLHEGKFYIASPLQDADEAIKLYEEIGRVLFNKYGFPTKNSFSISPANEMTRTKIFKIPDYIKKNANFTLHCDAEWENDKTNITIQIYNSTIFGANESKNVFQVKLTYSSIDVEGELIEKQNPKSLNKDEQEKL